MQFFFDDSDEHVGGHGAPDLRLHRVLAGAKKFLDAQMLFDPFEEQLHLPTALEPLGCNAHEIRVFSNMESDKICSNV